MADNNFTLTQEYINTIFDYKNGELFWKVRQSNRIHIGNKAGCLDSTHRYYKVRINKKIYNLHRIIFFMFHGYFPKIVDHINQIKTDNKIENLREANLSQNNWNCKTNLKNTSGYQNVVWRKDRNKWTVRLQINGKVKAFGAFDDIEEANKAAIKLRKELHGEFVSIAH